MLAAVIGQHRVGQVTFQQFRPPDLPFPQQLVELVEAVRLRMPGQHGAGGGRRPGAPVELDDMRFPPGEQLIQHGQVADDHGDEADAGARLEHSDQARAGSVRHHVAVAQGEEGDAAHVKRYANL